MESAAAALLAIGKRSVESVMRFFSLCHEPVLTTLEPSHLKSQRTRPRVYHWGVEVVSTTREPSPSPPVHALVSNRSIILFETTTIVASFLVSEMGSVASVMRFFSVCRQMRANKGLLVHVVKNLMPEVPRERWGRMDTMTFREYVILYRNTRFGDRNHPYKFVRPGKTPADAVVRFWAHTSTTFAEGADSEEYCIVPNSRRLINARDQSKCVWMCLDVLLHAFLTDGFSEDQGEESTDGCVSLTIIRRYGIFVSLDTRRTFADVIEQRIRLYQTPEEIEKAIGDSMLQYIMNIPLLNALLGLVKSSFDIGLIPVFRDSSFNFFEGIELFPGRSLDRVQGIHLDVCEDDLRVANLTLPRNRQLVMARDDEIEPIPDLSYYKES